MDNQQDIGRPKAFPNLRDVIPSIKAEEAKFFYIGDTPVGLAKRNGHLRFFKLIEVGYADLESAFKADL